MLTAINVTHLGTDDGTTNGTCVSDTPGEAEGYPTDNIIIYLYFEFLAHGLEYSHRSSVTLFHDL